tara:strand:- start:1011 stop:2369 length:1359 start_codon:yes stop_codon:yes gene_type:complete
MDPNSIRFNITAQKETTYPYEVKTLNMEDDAVNYYSPTLAKYVKALKEKGAKKGSKAVMVETEISLDAYYCLGASSPSVDSENYSYFLPYDPVTVYEVVPKNEWRPIQNPISKDIVRNNPCLNPESISDKPNKIIPSNNIYFYFWHPTLKAKDVDGNSFNCSDWYKLGESYQRVSPKFFKLKESGNQTLPFKELTNLDRPIKVSLAMGFNTSPHVKLDPTQIKELINKSFTIKSKKEIDTILPYLKKDSDVDHSVSRMILFLWRFKNYFKVNDKVISADQDQLKIRLKGILLQSKLPLDISFYLGTSKPALPSFIHTKDFVAESLLQSDIFIYEGHSGFGQAINPRTLDLEEYVSKFEGKVPDNQIYALFSCQAYFNYHQDVFKVIPVSGKRGWIHSLGDYRELTSNGSLGMFAYLDHLGSNKDPIPFEDWATVFANDNFIKRSVEIKSNQP